MTQNQNKTAQQADLLAIELHELEVDTFEIEDMADTEQHALSSTCSSSSSSSCSSCSSKVSPEN
ncbi:MAG TPA: thiazolylpeptide-type bacteriocin [Ktedonobacteraceae bacterium]|nr:thiazolylpeptide-type bacteriocin [Ktedonobacteraceae bacterium]